MWYVMSEYGLEGEYASYERAYDLCMRLNENGVDAWICSDEE
jgi:hypothetical protein